MTNSRILVVDDEPQLRRVLRSTLSALGFVVDDAETGEAALERVREERFDLVLLDINMPGLSGLETCRAMRARSDVSILMLTVRNQTEDKVEAFDAGADDYIVKPFDLDEVSARMRSVLRRANGRGDPCIRAGGICLNPATHVVEQQGVPVQLLAHEYAVLEALLQRPGAILSRAQLEDRLYGWDTQVESNAVEVYIHSLRRKLGSEAIRTLRGVGYFIPKE